MAAGGLVVSVANMTKSFRDVRALNGLDLKVKSGIFGLIGPNGAGKTTLLRILLGLIRPDKGEGRVLGLDIREDSLRIRSTVGMLHERPSYPKAMAVADYLERVGRLYRTARSPKEVLDMVGLSYASSRTIGNLSAGMHQRLGIAQALVGNPELVFLDEPTSNLDVTGRDDTVRLIVKLHQELGVSFFISSHILSELERACHNVAFISAGRIVEKGSVIETIKKHTANSFRIVTSDSRGLFKALDGKPGLRDAVITGANTITVSVDKNQLNAIKAEVERIAESLGIKIYAFEQAGTLEDAFKEIMRDE